MVAPSWHKRSTEDPQVAKSRPLGNRPEIVGLRWGGDDGVLNWAIGIDMYTLMCIKLMTNKNLQYKKTNKKNN